MKFTQFFVNFLSNWVISDNSESGSFKALTIFMGNDNF